MSPAVVDHPNELREVAWRVVEVEKCRDGLPGFLYWCEHYAQIEDKDARRWAPFLLYPGQKIIARHLVEGEWVCALKARQLGITWLAVAYALWRISFTPMYQVICLNADVPRAREFIKRLRGMRSRLPDWMRPNFKDGGINNLSEIEFEVNGEEANIRSVAASEGSGRTFTADLVVIDEAALIGILDEVIQAIGPTLETSGGQMMLISTSRGAANNFARTYNAEDSGFVNVFLSWRHRPGRTQEWYEREVRKNRYRPLHMPREFPETAAEAFEFGPGRMIPMFRERTHVPKGNRLDYFDELMRGKRGWERYRGIDFGTSEAHPFVCLWMMFCPGKPRLYVHPSCENTIREFVEYRRNPLTGIIIKENDHTVDAFRYVITSAMLFGTVYVYRELYVPDPHSLGLSILDLTLKIHDMSGWTQVQEHKWMPGEHGEVFVDSIADRSGRENIRLMSEHGMDDIRPAIDVRTKKMPLQTTSLMEVEQGIEIVNALVCGTIPFDSPELPLDKLEEKRLTRGRERLLPKHSQSLREIYLQQKVDELEGSRHGNRHDVLGVVV